MDFVLTALAKDLARWRQDAAAILLWMSIPLLIGILITSLVDRGDGGKPQGVLLISDQDDTVLSSLVASAYSQGELGELILVEQVSALEGARRINDGEASGFLIIPEGFSAALLNSDPITLTLKSNPSQTILPGIITDVTEVILDLGFYAHQLFGEEISLILDQIDGGGGGEMQVAAISVAIQQKIETVAPLLFPPVIDPVMAEPPPEEASVPFALLFLPGIILMSVMFSANGLAGDLWTERELGTLRRLVCSPGQLNGFLLGKALAAGLVIAAIGGVTLAIGFLYHGIGWPRFPSALIWLAVSGIALFSWFAVLQMIAPSRKSASLITSMFLFPLLMLGGSFFPFEALPDWLAALGRRTPNGFVTDRLTTEITAGSAWAIDLNSWILILGIGLMGILLCSWRLRSGFAGGQA